MEIFQLNNELGALRELLDDQDSSATRSFGGAEQVGALPDFVIIGAPRCGTSRFYGLLTKHPNVERAAVKEIHYFNRPERFEKGIDWYKRCFSSPGSRESSESITGEATPSYLAHSLAAERMAEINPEVKLIALLRNPVDRAYSRYNQRTRWGSPLSFEEALEVEQELLQNERNSSELPDLVRNLGAEEEASIDLLITGIYVDHLRRWHKHFSKEQMLILKSEDFYERTTDTVNRVQDFLDLPREELDLPSHKTRYSYEPMNPDTRRKLEAFFEPHNQRLYEYLGVDFGW